MVTKILNNSIQVPRSYVITKAVHEQLKRHLIEMNVSPYKYNCTVFGYAKETSYYTINYILPTIWELNKAVNIVKLSVEELLTESNFSFPRLPEHEQLLEELHHYPENKLEETIRIMQLLTGGWSLQVPSHMSYRLKSYEAHVQKYETDFPYTDYTIKPQQSVPEESFPEYYIALSLTQQRRTVVSIKTFFELSKMTGISPRWLSGASNDINWFEGCSIIEQCFLDLYSVQNESYKKIMMNTLREETK